MNLDQAAVTLSALGHKTRLRIFRLLVKAGRKGLNVGVIAEQTQIPLSTLFHHVGHLEKAGLVVKTKLGRETLCATNYQQMDAVIAYLEKDCCIDTEC